VLDDSIEGLQQHMAMSWLAVGMRNAPAASVLQAMPDVVCVEDLGGGRMRLQYRPEAPDFPERLVARAVAEGWRLHEIAQERRSLEEIFVELTRAEEASEGALA
jgi:ABC-2 type transport system ATP-binding protein